MVMVTPRNQDREEDVSVGRGSERTFKFSLSLRCLENVIGDLFMEGVGVIHISHLHNHHSCKILYNRHVGIYITTKLHL